MIVFAFSCNILNDVHVNLIPFVFVVAVAAYYLPQNAGDLARKYITDPDLLSFIDAEVSSPRDKLSFRGSLVWFCSWRLLAGGFENIYLFLMFCVWCHTFYDMNMQTGGCMCSAL